MTQGPGQAQLYEGSWAQLWNDAGISVCGLDLQGCGRSEGKRGLRFFCEQFEVGGWVGGVGAAAAAAAGAGHTSCSAWVGAACMHAARPLTAPPPALQDCAVFWFTSHLSLSAPPLPHPPHQQDYVGDVLHLARCAGGVGWGVLGGVLGACGGSPACLPPVQAMPLCSQLAGCICC